MAAQVAGHPAYTEAGFSEAYYEVHVREKLTYLAVGPDGRVLCLYEAERYGCLRLARFEATWIEERERL